jgi:hypothetical protein
MISAHGRNLADTGSSANGRNLTDVVKYQHMDRNLLESRDASGYDAVVKSLPDR